LFCTFSLLHKIQRKPFVYGGSSGFTAIPPRPLSDPFGVAVECGGMPIFSKVDIKLKIIIGKTSAFISLFLVLPNLQLFP
jgi:hypothetical protein